MQIPIHKNSCNTCMIEAVICVCAYHSLGTEDFVPLAQGTVITGSFSMMRSLCQTVTIRGDRFIENDEFFFVMVIPSNPLDSINRNYSQITVLDDDGMLNDSDSFKLHSQPNLASFPGCRRNGRQLPCKCLGCSLCLWPTLTAGATVSLNETDIVVQEGDGNTTVDICVVLQDDMGGLERDIVVTMMLMQDTTSKPTGGLVQYVEYLPLYPKIDVCSNASIETYHQRTRYTYKVFTLWHIGLQTMHHCNLVIFLGDHLATYF